MYKLLSSCEMTHGLFSPPANQSRAWSSLKTVLSPLLLIGVQSRRERPTEKKEGEKKTKQILATCTVCNVSPAICTATAQKTRRRMGVHLLASCLVSVQTNVLFYFYY